CGRGDGGRAGLADGIGGAVGAGDGRVLVDGQEEALGRGDAVVGGEGQEIVAAGARFGHALQRRGAVAVVGEGHVLGQGSRLGDGGGWVSGRGDGERAGLADGEGGVVGAGERRGLDDGQGEALSGAGRDAVVGGEGQEIVGDCARFGRALQRRGAVAVVFELHAVGQVSRLGDGGGREAGRGDGERAELADGEGGVVGAGDGGGGEDRVDDRVKINRRLDLQGCVRVADDDLVWGIAADRGIGIGINDGVDVVELERLHSAVEE